MKRSVGVTVVAILSLLGSAFTFAMGIVMLAVMALAPASRANQSPGSPSFFKIMLLLASLMYFLPAVWGIVTGIGLWRLREWARISILVFSVLLILMGGFTGLAMLVIPIPVAPNSTVDPAMMSGIRTAMGGFFLILLGIGVGWLVFFNRAKVKQQFGRGPAAASGELPLPSSPQSGLAGATGTATKRPLSITILAWLLVMGSVFILFSLLMHAPAILFTELLTGWPAVLFLLAFAAAQLWIGVGLLRLRPAARMAAIIYFAFGFVNSAVFYLAPGAHARSLLLMESERTMFPWMRLQNQPNLQFDITPFFTIGAVAGLIGVTVPLYFLITRKFAFDRTAADLGSGTAGLG